MDFTLYANEFGEVVNPFAGKNESESWISGVVDANWLNENFGQYQTLDECVQATDSEGLKLFFEHLKPTQ